MILYISMDLWSTTVARWSWKSWLMGLTVCRHSSRPQSPPPLSPFPQMLSPVTHPSPPFISACIPSSLSPHSRMQRIWQPTHQKRQPQPIHQFWALSDFNNNDSFADSIKYSVPRTHKYKIWVLKWMPKTCIGINCSYTHSLHYKSCTWELRRWEKWKDNVNSLSQLGSLVVKQLYSHLYRIPPQLCQKGESGMQLWDISWWAVGDVQLSVMHI